jgi:hypothetical protein
MTIVDELCKLGVSVQEDAGSIKAYGALTDKTRAIIRDNKQAILDDLRSRYAPKPAPAPAMAPKPDVGPVSLDPVEYLRIAAELIAACPESLRAVLKRYHDERLRWWRSVPEVAFAADGPPVMAYGELDELCQREHGVWLAVWYLPDGKFRTEVCRAERRRPEAIQQRQQAAMPESRETKTDNSLFAGSV